MKNQIKVEKLVNADNFLVWKKTLSVLLRSKELMDIVENKEQKAETNEMSIRKRVKK